MARKRGRLSIIEQHDLEIKMRECFLNRLEPKTIAALKIANIKTVQSYYTKLLEEIQANIKKPFLEQAKEQKERAIMQLKLQILKFTVLSSPIEEKLKTQRNNPGTKSYRENMKLFLALQNKITELTMKILDIKNSPIADVSLDTNTAELMKKYGHAITQ